MALTLRPMNFMDSGARDYSSRVGNALFLAAADPDSTPDAILTFLQQLYRILDTGLSNEAMAEVAESAALPPAVVERISLGQQGIDTAAMGEHNEDRLEAVVGPAGLGVPTVHDLVREEVIELNPGWLDTLTN